MVMDKYNRNKKKIPTIKRFMSRKLAITSLMLGLALFALTIRTVYIVATSGDDYAITVLNQQEYKSTVIPFKRGNILDRNGNTLATSIKVYNMVIDSKIMLSDEGKYYEPTISTIQKYFSDIDGDKIIDAVKTEGKFDIEKLKSGVKADSSRNYWVVMKHLSYSEIEPYQEFMASEDKDDRKINSKVEGIWFEEEYERKYPQKKLGCSVIGFSTGMEGGASLGIEAYYDDFLTGTNGRKYGYVNSDSNMEGVVKAAKNGDTVVSTLDINIQRIVQKKIKEYMKKFRPKRMAVVIADPNTGEILAMADNKTFDLNDPFFKNKNYSTEKLSEIWRNYCVNEIFEPGSTAKPFTVAAAFEEGVVDENTSFVCDGGQPMGGYYIRCHKDGGHGTISVKQAVAYSCNDALMQIGALLGVDSFCDYQTRFGFGFKTGIDLPAEERGLTYDLEDMGPTDLACNAFGQNFSVNMIQMVAGFSSLINGGYYYEPHVVKEIQTEEGAVVESYVKRLVRQTITEQTSTYIRECLRAVVTDGTGKTAAIPGYTVSGKTGTAEKIVDGKRGSGQYIVSFLGAVPAEKPEVVCYTLMDSPEDDPDSTAYNTEFWSAVMKEVLPYLHIAKTEDLGDDPDINGTEQSDINEDYNNGIINYGDGSLPEEDGNGEQPTVGE